ncbi:hypothetical protein Fmac_010502 [Flemingia macrophylla]|uniref:Uncharacterized protein n=1 Tax=Flemingia macrophylla TaxID=520843 RepID=A0ABD1MJR8_9FABA
MTTASSFPFLQELENFKLDDVEQHIVKIRKRSREWKCQRWIPFWGVLPRKKKKHGKKKEEKEKTSGKTSDMRNREKDKKVKKIGYGIENKPTLTTTHAPQETKIPNDDLNHKSNILGLKFRCQLPGRYSVNSLPNQTYPQYFGHNSSYRPPFEKDNLIPSSQTTNYSQSIQLKATRIRSRGTTFMKDPNHKSNLLGLKFRCQVPSRYSINSLPSQTYPQYFRHNSSYRPPFEMIPVALER